MEIDIEMLRQQQRELNRVSDEVLFVKRKLKRYRNALDDAWKSTEIKGMDSSIEDIILRLNRMSKELEEIGHDVMSAGGELMGRESLEAGSRNVLGP